ncbi:fluoride efflux transporter CrcB [uncultured Desulfobacter sp.]|uniref:fluoride efflux transporter CrcB n=1 Tax=uncultured Desulfobacter sp. TaxID=240139 RepID=UPI002AABE582|nr:fluoride efflux transporter CrcB [uncultured Desulfobacter sp.]
MIKIVMVGLGGAMGAMCRYLVYEGYINAVKDEPLPLGTITVNVLGCFIIGFLGGLADARQIFPPEIRLLIFTGFLGGFTTFSTFGFELFLYMRNGQIGLAILNGLIQLCAGLVFVWAGFMLSKAF